MSDNLQWAPYRGTVVEAEYCDTGVEGYEGNAHIEALGPIPTMKSTGEYLSVHPQFDPADRTLPAELRIEVLCTTLAEFYQPLALHLDVARRLHGMLRRGYKNRNPVDAHRLAEISKAVDQLETGRRLWRAQRTNGLGGGMSILGISGVGKTSLLQAVLSMIPQVIHHGRYRGHSLMHAQVSWLLLDCPYDGSIKALCHRFFEAFDKLLGTSYLQHYTKGNPPAHKLTPEIANIAALHGLGMLIVDELQHLSPSKSQGHPNMLNFFVDLENVLGIPVVRVGTYKAIKLLQGEFRQARRGLATGDLSWDRMTIEASAEEGWSLFWRGLWRYQYTDREAVWSDQFSKVLFSHTQGVTDLCLKLFAMAQIRAIEHGEEMLTPERIEIVARRDFRTIEKALAALRSGNDARLAEWEDLLPPKLTLREEIELRSSTGLVDVRTDEAVEDYEPNPVPSSDIKREQAAASSCRPRNRGAKPAQQPSEPALAAKTARDDLEALAFLPDFVTSGR